MRSRIDRQFTSLLATLFVAVLPFLFSLSPAYANALKTITGVPVVQAAGELVIDGQRIILWGIDSLASDQQCWQGDTAWCCGESSIMALRHYVDGRAVECEVQHYTDEGATLVAKCYRTKGATKQDIAAHLVAQGWALERGATTGGLYYHEEQAAQENKRGIWSGRFQSAQDWREGVQRYFGDPPEEHNEPAQSNP